MTFVCFIFCGVEATGGIMSDSLAILTDAAHQLSDVAGFVISLFAVWFAQKHSSVGNSYGYHRCDVLGAIGSILIIWGLLIWLLIEAVHRIFNPSEIDGTIMLVTACIGLCCNITNLLILNFCGNEVNEEGEQINLF